MTELKPCPFCGGTKLKIDSKKSNNTKWEDGIRYSHHVVTVRCNRCFTRGPVAGVFLRGTSYHAVDAGKDKAIEAWNRRVGYGESR